MCQKLQLIKKCKRCDSTRDSQAETKLCDEAKSWFRGHGAGHCRMGIKTLSQSVEGYVCLRCQAKAQKK
jgi:hypothetical protein